MIPTLRTDRLTLRPMGLADFDPYAAFRAGDRSPSPGGPVDRRTAWSMFCEDVACWSLRGYGKLVIEETGRAKPVGLAGLVHAFGWDGPELAWSIFDAADERKGFATEAMRAVLAFCRDGLGWARAISLVEVGNDASTRLALRLGGIEDRRVTEGDRTYVVFHHPLRAA